MTLLMLLILQVHQVDVKAGIYQSVLGNEQAIKTCFENFLYLKFSNKLVHGDTGIKGII